MGDPEGGGSLVTGRIRLRLRLVRPESELEMVKKEEAQKLAAQTTDLTQITLSLEDELEGYFGVRCSFSNRDLLIWVGSGSNRRQWIKEISRCVILCVVMLCVVVCRVIVCGLYSLLIV